MTVMVPSPRPPMVPAVVEVADSWEETHDTFSLRLKPPADEPAMGRFRPGQFNMLYLFGVGEVPISMSGDPVDETAIVHTIRAVGSVTNGLAKMRPGQRLGLRGPFGSSWPADVARGRDVVVVTGGIGLAPLRPFIYHLLRYRKDYGRIVLLYGARSPRDLLYVSELEAWRDRGDFQVLVTVDHADPNWHGSVGLVTSLMAMADFDAGQAIGMTCGPEVMMRFVLEAFEKRGVNDERLYLSQERNMQCAVGFCGHCQFGPNFVCMDGPVFRYDRIKSFFQVREA